MDSSTDVSSLYCKSPTSRRKLPSMNSTPLYKMKDGDVVRFVGMIQDMHNPEFYFESYELHNRRTDERRVCSGKYKDASDIGESETIDYNSPMMKSAERHTVTVVSLPGLNEWAKIDENTARIQDTQSAPPSANSAPNAGVKRSLDDESHDDVNKKSHSDNINEASEQRPSTSMSRDYLLNHPIPDENGKVCLVKIYDKFENLKLNDMIEITGYLSIDPEVNRYTNKDETSDDNEMDLETIAHNPPPSLIPRIHALHIEKLEHCNPLLKEGYSKESIVSETNEAREHLHTALSQILFGDTLAADYLICHLISHVFARKDVITLGKFSLNLWRIPIENNPNYSDSLYDIIKKIVTKSHYFPLTVDNLNDLCLLPKKDYDCNRLTSGILQLSKNTHLVLDETKMQPGQLNQAGITNLASLGNLIQSQKVEYDFKFYKMEYDCDIPVLVLSEGKSLLPSEFTLPLKSDQSMVNISNEIFEAANHYLNEGVLNKIRKYLSAVQLIEYQIPEEPQYIQDDFISMRRENHWGREVKEDDLHRLLVLTRLVCLSRGFDTINKDCWDIAVNMENERNQRLRFHTK